jgi:hypothetical protein
MLRPAVQSLPVVLFASSVALAQSWDPNKGWMASLSPAFPSPNPKRYVDADGAFPGWTMDDTVNVTHQAPSANPGGIAGWEASYFAVTSGKEKHRTGNWGELDGNGSTRTAVFWRIYIPSSPAIDRMPSIQIRTHGERHHLDFDPDVHDGGAPPESGWGSAEGTSIISGGKERLNGSGERYLPMTMDEWHTIRVEITGPNGEFEAWIDEEGGLSDVRHVTCLATKDGSGNYIEIGCRSTVSRTQFWTNYLVWGQDTTATGGVNQILPLPDVPVEICDNGLDDDDNGLADCADPKCECQITPEDTLDACTNALDDDVDGVIDCWDPDCQWLTHCGEDQPHYALTLVRQIGHWQASCSPWCGANVFVSVYDEFGNPINGAVVKDPIRSDSLTTIVTNPDPGQGPDGQGGHGRTNSASLPGTWRFRVASDSAGIVSSDVTPDLISSVPPDDTQYSWQLEFMRVSRRDQLPEFTPREPTYIFDSVQINPPGGGNPTVFNDESDLFVEGAVMFGQTFTANCDRIVSARFELTRGPFSIQQYEATIHPVLENPPTSMADIGPQIGPARRGPNNMIGSEWWTQMLNWPLEGDDSVPVVPGQTYFAKIRLSVPPNDAFNHFRTEADYHPGGQAFRMLTLGGALLSESGSDLVGYVVGATTGDIVEEPPVLVGAGSSRLHGITGYPIELPIAGPPATEPRMNGQEPRLGLIFDKPIEAADGTIDCGEVNITNGTCHDVFFSGSNDKALIIDMTFDNNACVTVAVTGIRGAGGGPAMVGDNDVQILVRQGNVNGDGDVNVIDLQDVKNHVFQPVDGTNFMYDVDTDGQINVVDLQVTKNNLFTDAACP